MIGSLDELVERVWGCSDLYVRWSPEPEVDQDRRSRDELTGVELPGLSASALAVEPWWDDRPPRLWVARRIYDDRHLEYRRQGAQPWLVRGRECGRGPDNEPLLEAVTLLGRIGPEAVAEASDLVESQRSDWGPLERAGSVFRFDGGGYSGGDTRQRHRDDREVSA